MERWLDIKRNRNEANNRNFAVEVKRLGTLYKKCNRLPEAVTTNEQALSLYQKYFGKKDPRTMVLRGELNRLKQQLKKQKSKTKS